MDEELNRAIDAALDELRAVKPAPDFLPRLRAHVERVPAAAPIRWWIPFAASATAIVAGEVVAALLTLVNRSRIQQPAAPDRAVAGVTAAPRQPSTAASGSDSPAPQKTAAVVRPTRLGRRVVPPAEAGAVLVPPGQLAAIGRLLDAINAGDEHAASAVRKLGTGVAIEIVPIQIEPVVVPEIKETKESSSW